MIPSRSQRAVGERDSAGLGGSSPAGGPPGGTPKGGSSTATAGMFGSDVTAGRLDGSAGRRGSGRRRNDRCSVATGTKQGARSGFGGGAVADRLDAVDQDAHTTV